MQTPILGRFFILKILLELNLPNQIVGLDSTAYLEVIDNVDFDG